AQARHALADRTRGVDVERRAELGGERFEPDAVEAFDRAFGMRRLVGRKKKAARAVGHGPPGGDIRSQPSPGTARSVATGRTCPGPSSGSGFRRSARSPPARPVRVAG